MAWREAGWEEGRAGEEKEQADSPVMQWGSGTSEDDDTVGDGTAGYTHSLYLFVCCDLWPLCLHTCMPSEEGQGEKTDKIIINSINENVS